MSPRGARRRALLAAGASLALPAPPSRAAPAGLGEVVEWPDVRLLDGARFGRADVAGAALVVVFYSIHCPFCRRHNRRVNRLVDESDATTLRVLGVAAERDPDAVRAHARGEGIRFPVTLEDSALRPLFTSRGVVPFTCAVDRAGRLREAIPGEMSEDDVLALAKWARAGT